MKRGGKSKKQKAQKEYISGRAFILSLYLAACVININSTKWVVIKLSRVVNNPQRSHWNIKADRLLCTSTDMQPNVYFKFVHYTEPLPSTTLALKSARKHTHIYLCCFLIGWAVWNTITWSSVEKIENEQNVLSLDLEKKIVGRKTTK